LLGGRSADPIARVQEVVRHLLVRDVFGQLEVRGARPLFLRDSKRLAHARRNALRMHDLVRALGDRPHQLDDVDDLELALLALGDRLLPGEHQHRHRTELRIRRRSHQVRGAGTERREAHARFAGETAVRRGHEAGRLLVPRQDQADARAAQRLEHVEVLFTGHAEDVLHALVLERFDQQVRGVHGGTK
jgi:hypothetical protein